MCGDKTFDKTSSPVTGGSGRNAGRFLGLERGWGGVPSHELLSDEQRLEGQKSERSDSISSGLREGRAQKPKE